MTDRTKSDRISTNLGLQSGFVDTISGDEYELYHTKHRGVRQSFREDIQVRSCYRSKASEIDLIIEENGILYPVEIKQSPTVSAVDASVFPILDKIEEKQRGMGAVICSCPQPNLLRNNLLQMPVWYI